MNNLAESANNKVKSYIECPSCGTSTKYKENGDIKKGFRDTSHFVVSITGLNNIDFCKEENVNLWFDKFHIGHFDILPVSVCMDEISTITLEEKMFARDQN